MHPNVCATVDLKLLFEELNRIHFDGFLDPPRLQWNSRLRSCAGRFIPGSRKFWESAPPRIEIAAYLLEEKDALTFITDTMAHEMIHYWLWVRRKPYGHTFEFISKMKEMGVSRYNPVPRSRPFKYVYACNFCQKAFPARKKLGTLACAKCCQEFSQGRYDVRFKLILSRMLGPGETI
jgi:predicted SprT family Zn-dependent metalloprotease